MAGLIPGVGEVADVANGFISLARGNYEDAALSFVSMVPVIGDAIGKGGKTARFIEKSSGKTAGGGQSNKSIKLSNDRANTNSIQTGGGHNNVQTNNQSRWPKTRADLDADLKAKGFEYKGKSPGGYETYKGPDGRTVTIKPDGEVIPVQKVWKKDGSGKFPQRQDYDGNPLPDQSHSTGYFVE